MADQVRPRTTAVTAPARFVCTQATSNIAAAVQCCTASTTTYLLENKESMFYLSHPPPYLLHVTSARDGKC